MNKISILALVWLAILAFMINEVQEAREKCERFSIENQYLNYKG